MKIPRAEVWEITKTVQTAADKVFNKKILVTVCGSFRRGRAECGDVDLLLTTRPKQSLVPVSTVLPKLISALEETGFL